jgi:hypothetical protein
MARNRRTEADDGPKTFYVYDARLLEIAQVRVKMDPNDTGLRTVELTPEQAENFVKTGQIGEDPRRASTE